MFARLVFVTAMLCIVLVGPWSASAALYLSIAVDPEAPRALEPVRVEVQSLAVFNGNCLNEPGARATPMVFFTVGDVQFSGPIELTVLRPAAAASGETGTLVPPERDEFTLMLLVSDHDPTIWEGEIVFPNPGEWTLRVTFPDYGAADPSCTGHEETVVMSPVLPEGTPATGTPVVTVAR